MRAALEAVRAKLAGEPNDRLVTIFACQIHIASILYGCASLPSGCGFFKTSSSALDHPELTRSGRQFETAGREHHGNSGFRIIPAGADGFQIRMQMINAAERTLDLQDLIFHEDETGRLLTDAVLHAADRGVRVSILVDDAEMDGR